MLANSKHAGEHKVQVDGKFQMKYQKALQWKSNFTLNIKKQLEVTLKWSRYYRVEYVGGHEYEVKDNEKVNHIVHLGRMTCVCREWEISGLPCKHVVAVICHSRLTLEDFVHPYYSKQNYLKANGGIIHPILDHTMWTLILGDPLQPPPLKRLLGRPRNARKRVVHEPPAGTSQIRGGASGSGTSARRGSGTSEGRGSGITLDRGRCSVKGTSTERGTSTRKGTSMGKGTSIGREQLSGKGSSTGRGRGKGKGKGKAKHAHMTLLR
ncbi:hypothetical protein ACSBR2_017530 [Camellia fascicularis]